MKGENLHFNISKAQKNLKKIKLTLMIFILNK